MALNSAGRGPNKRETPCDTLIPLYETKHPAFIKAAFTTFLLRCHEKDWKTEERDPADINNR